MLGYLNVKSIETEPLNLNITGSNAPLENKGYITIFLNICTNSTFKNECYPQDYIDKMLINVYVTKQYTNFEVDSKDQSPLKEIKNG